VPNVGLVLSGGGARAGYQVGAIRGLAAILGPSLNPFRVVAGVSAGAINGVALAVGAHDFPEAAERLARIWLSLTPDKVYRTDFPSLASLGFRWMRDLGSGGALGKSRANHLLDTTPLRELLVRELDVARIPEQLAAGHLRGLAVSATNYLTGNIVSFFDGVPSVQPWTRQGRIAIRERIEIDHVMASAAIPVFFPPVSIDGAFFGDGGVRMTTPISPAIHLGAEKIVSIGIRHHASTEETVNSHRTAKARTLSVSEIAGTLLNSVFLDSLDNDIERLERINRTLGFVPDEARKRLPDPLRRIPSLALRPSTDLGKLAADQYEKFPATLRHLLRGIGATGERGWDLLSYLAFQPEYVGKLIELGYQDTLSRAREIEAFFATESEDVAPPSMLPGVSRRA
jgi:NTE family protein